MNRSAASSSSRQLATTGRRLAGLFVDLFEKTFALQLRVVGPQGVLWLRGLSAEELDALGALRKLAPSKIQRKHFRKINISVFQY